MLNALRKRSERRQTVVALTERIVERARVEVFYAALGVPDTIDGRFDLFALHAWLVLDAPALKQNRVLSQALVDHLFVHFDEALREQGAGDIGMTRRVSRMADAFYGRLNAYGEAEGTEALTEAIVRNVFRGQAGRVDAARALAIYAQTAKARLAEADMPDADFGPLPDDETQS